MQSISLADELTLDAGRRRRRTRRADLPGAARRARGEPRGARARGVSRGYRLGRAAAALRIEKRIPIAAGLGGGSADAAAALRLAHAASGLGDERLLRELARELGADVPAQVAPGRWLASGAGELLQALAAPLPALELLVLPATAALSTAAVYAEADRLGGRRNAHELEQLATQLRVALALGAPLPALARAAAQRPAGAGDLACARRSPRRSPQSRDAGAHALLVSGSGPTVLALFDHANASARRERAERALAGLAPAPVAARSVGAEFARAVALP